MEQRPQTLLRSAYGVQPITWTRLRGNEHDKRVFEVTLPNGTRWVVRAYPPENTRSDVAATARVLLALEAARYPAERLVQTIDGAAFAAADGWRLLATRLVAGLAIDWEAAPWEQIGALLGRLHASFHRSPLLAALPVAERSLEQELQLSLADLESVAAALPPQFAATYAELLRAIQTTQRRSHLPQTLIHNDYHPGNMLQTPDGALTIIDWEGAGTSPPILDLGFVLSSSYPRPARRPDPARINALVDGYCQQHHLTHTELGGLFDAVRLRPIAFLTSELPLMVADPGWHNPDYGWWQARYAASAEIAALAYARFERSI